jgi:hypothetical protein
VEREIGPARRHLSALVGELGGGRHLGCSQPQSLSRGGVEGGPSRRATFQAARPVSSFGFEAEFPHGRRAGASRLLWGTGSRQEVLGKGRLG